MSDNTITIYVPHTKLLPFQSPPLTGEYLAARRISPTLAKITSIPMGTTQVSRGDLVEIDPEGVLVAVVEQATRCRHAAYDAAAAAIRAVGDAADDAGDAGNGVVAAADAVGDAADVQAATLPERLEHYMGKFDIAVEHGLPGFLGLAVPNNIDDLILNVVCNQCVPPLRLLDSEDQEDVPVERTPPPGTDDEGHVPEETRTPQERKPFFIKIHYLRTDDGPLTLAEFEAIPREPLNGEPLGHVNDYWSSCPNHHEESLSHENHLHIVWVNEQDEPRRACMSREPPPNTDPEQWRKRYEELADLPRLHLLFDPDQPE